MEITLEPIIAERHIELAGTEEEPARVITVSLGMPRPFPNGTSFYCPYRISGFPKDRLQYAGGIDSFQALQLAQNMISVEMEVRKDAFGERLRWEAGTGGDLGFPMFQKSSGAIPGSGGSD